MKYRYTIALLLAAGLHAGDAAGQATAAPAAAEREAAEERLRAEAERQRADVARVQAERRAVERDVVTVEDEMRAAEARLEEAARRIAELSGRQLPLISTERWEFATGNRPVLGISIDGETGDGPVEGVAVRGVSPGGAAFDAGLRAGDVLTAINDESLAAADSASANRKLLDFMRGVESGDALDVQYLRDGKVANVELTPRSAQRFVFAGPRPVPLAMPVPGAPGAPRAPAPLDVMIWRDGVGWADLEMVALTEGLGRYFGTDKGLLVVRAPSDGKLELQDGDVIQSIGGREPTSVSHAVRILASYQPGETLELEIMRDKRKRKLEVEIPDHRQGGVVVPLPGNVVTLRSQRVE